MPTDTSNQYSPSGAYDLGTPTNRVGNIFGTSKAVTQLTSNTTAVTLNATSGVITNFGTAITTGNSSTFTVNNTFVTAGSCVTCSVCGFAGVYTTNGIPVANVTSVATGSFAINISNVHAANSTGANAITVAFDVIG